MTDTQLIADLHATRAELVKRGRCIGDLFDAQGRVCLIGAIIVATGRELAVGTRLGPRGIRCRRALKEQLGGQEPASFNDYHPDDRDVLELIEKTLATLGGLT